jgi:hypothetical protein
MSALPDAYLAECREKCQWCAQGLRCDFLVPILEHQSFTDGNLPCTAPSLAQWAADQHAEVVRLRTECGDLQRLFDLQHTRTVKAELLWRKATGQHNVLPDLGVLIDWLLDRVEKAETEVVRLEPFEALAQCLDTMFLLPVALIPDAVADLLREVNLLQDSLQRDTERLKEALRDARNALQPFAMRGVNPQAPLSELDCSDAAKAYAAIDAVIAERDPFERDKERLDWLETHKVIAEEECTYKIGDLTVRWMDSGLMRLDNEDATGLKWTTITWREAIDAAMAKEREGGEGAK